MVSARLPTPTPTPQVEVYRLHSSTSDPKENGTSPRPSCCLAFTEREGRPTHLDVHGPLLAAATDKGCLKVRVGIGTHTACNIRIGRQFDSHTLYSSSTPPATRRGSSAARGGSSYPPTTGPSPSAPSASTPTARGSASWRRASHDSRRKQKRGGARRCTSTTWTGIPWCPTTSGRPPPPVPWP